MRRKSFSRYNAGLEAAKKHIREASQFHDITRGIDEEIKEIFFNLTPENLDRFLTLYGETFGKTPELYARETYVAWKKGVVHMSGLVADRIFSLLPPHLGPIKKREIAEKLWVKFSPSSYTRYEVKPKTDIDILRQDIDTKINELTYDAEIPDILKEKFDWLTSSGTVTYLELIAYFKKQEAQMLRRQIHPLIEAVSKSLISWESEGLSSEATADIKVHGHEIVIHYTNKEQRIQESFLQKIKRFLRLGA